MSYWRNTPAREDGGSNAEDLLQDLLVKARLDGSLRFPYVSHEPIILTITDFTIPRKGLHIFIDGPHHLKPNQQKLDVLIDEVLGLRKQTVIRHPYTPPMSNREADALLQEIIDAVK